MKEKFMNYYRSIFAAVSILVNLLAIFIIYLSFISPFDITLNDGTYMSGIQIFLTHLELVTTISLIASSIIVVAGLFAHGKASLKLSLAKIFLLNFLLLLFLFLLVYGYMLL